MGKVRFVVYADWNTSRPAQRIRTHEVSHVIYLAAVFTIVSVLALLLPYRQFFPRKPPS